VALTACACGGPQATGAAGGEVAFPPAAVTLAAARTTDIEDATEYVATLKSLKSTVVQPQIDGQITQIFIKSGDRVGQGARLLQIDPSRQQAVVSSQEAERAARQASVSFARQQHQRASELYAAGAISKQELEQADTGLRTTEANLEALQAQVQQAQVQLRYYTVSAPTAGIIGDIPVRVGNQVTTQTLLTTLDQNETLELHVSVPMERAGDLERGMPAGVLTSDGQRTLATTTIEFISPHVDEETQSVLVKGLVRNDGSLRASQFVRARIVWKTAPGLVVPVTAVLRINGQYFAFVAEDAGGKMVARQRAIKVGAIVGDSYIVLDGIKPNEQVVVSGAQKLTDNAPVQAAAPAPAAPTASDPKP
jgi:RND family efflux transporter MFP subunit